MLDFGLQFDCFRATTLAHSQYCLLFYITSNAPQAKRRNYRHLSFEGRLYGAQIATHSVILRYSLIWFLVRASSLSLSHFTSIIVSCVLVNMPLYVLLGRRLRAMPNLHLLMYFITTLSSASATLLVNNSFSGDFLVATS